MADIDWGKSQRVWPPDPKDKTSPKWSQSSADVVEMKYLHPKMVVPLPPVVGKQWDDSVAHPPEIPILTTGTPGMAMGGMYPGAGPRGMPDDLMGPPPMMPGQVPGMGMPGMPGATGQDVDPFHPNARPSPENPQNPVQPNELANQPAEYYLLRFMDYKVKPGKHYVYRVQLALSNPNYQMPANQLADPKLAKQQFLFTKWSDPSAVIAVPRDTRVLAVSVAPGHGSRDATGKVMLTKWVNTHGFLAHEEISSVERGQMLNYSDRKFRHSQGGNPMAAGMGAPPMGPAGVVDPMIAPGTIPTQPGKAKPPRAGAAKPRAGKAKPRPGEMFPPGFDDMGMMPVAPTPTGDQWLVNYYTNAIALDFRGGEKLAGRGSSDLKSVGEILLLDADGNLVVRNELDDKAERDENSGRGGGTDARGRARSGSRHAPTWRPIG